MGLIEDLTGYFKGKDLKYEIDRAYARMMTN
jgi:hypothetical protein